MTGRFTLPAGCPRKGWQLVDVEDLGEPCGSCAACGKESIRFVHHLRHAEAGLELEVGCVCARHLTEDHVGPRKLEAAARQRARAERRRIERAVSKAQWRCSPKGSWWCTIPGTRWRIVAWPHGTGWRAMLVNDALMETVYGGKTRPSYADHLLPAVRKVLASGSRKPCRRC